MKMDPLMAGLVGIGLGALVAEGARLALEAARAVRDDRRASTPAAYKVEPLPWNPDVKARPLDGNIVVFDRAMTDPDIQRRLRLYARISDAKRALGEDYYPGA